MSAKVAIIVTLPVALVMMFHGSLKSAVENFIFSVLVVAVIGASIYFLFHYFFTRRIQSVSTAAAKLATGDMNVRAGEKGTDETDSLPRPLICLPKR